MMQPCGQLQPGQPSPRSCLRPRCVPPRTGTSPPIKPLQAARGPHCPAAEFLADAPHGSVTYVSLLLTASLRALGPRWFPGALRGLPTLRPGRLNQRRAAELRGLLSMHRGSGGQQGDTHRGPTGEGLGHTAQLQCGEKLTSWRRSRRSPDLGRRNCRSPPLLPLCVGGGGPSRHTQSEFSCPRSAWPGNAGKRTSFRYKRRHANNKWSHLNWCG